MIITQVLMGKIQVEMKMDRQGAMQFFSSFSFLGTQVGNKTKLNGNLGEDVEKLAISKGVPNIYGNEMNLSFDNVEPAMNTMKQYDPDYGGTKLSLSSEEMSRYTKIGLIIACEYCCGVTSIVFPNARAACGCAHSQAMRGLLTYLIKYHGSEFSDDQLLRELARWKGRYFPKQMMNKVSEQIQSGEYTTDVASLLLDVKLPKYNNSKGKIPLPTSITDLPSMVGGC